MVLVTVCEKILLAVRYFYSMFIASKWDVNWPHVLYRKQQVIAAHCSLGCECARIFKAPHCPHRQRIIYRATPSPNATHIARDPARVSSSHPLLVYAKSSHTMLDRMRDALLRIFGARDNISALCECIDSSRRSDMSVDRCPIELCYIYYMLSAVYANTCPRDIQMHMFSDSL